MNLIKNQWLRGLVLATISASLLAFVLSRVDLAEVLSIFQQADLQYLAITLVFSLSAYAFLPTYRWHETLVAMGYRLPFLSLLFARFGAQPLKFCMPLKGGEAFRAIYLNVKHKVALPQGGGSLIFDMFLVAVGQLTFLCVGIALARGEVTHALLPTLAVFLTGLTLASKWFQEIVVKLSGHISTKLQKLVEQVSYGFLRFPLGTKIRLTCISYCVEFAEILTMYLSCKVLGITIPLWAILTFMPIVMAFTFIPVTISGLGTRDIAIFYLFSSFATPEQLASVALLFTFAEFIMPPLVGCFVLPSFLNVIGNFSIGDISAETNSAASSPDA